MKLIHVKDRREEGEGGKREKEKEGRGKEREGGRREKEKEGIEGEREGRIENKSRNKDGKRVGMVFMSCGLFLLPRKAASVIAKHPTRIRSGSEAKKLVRDVYMYSLAMSEYKRANW